MKNSISMNIDSVNFTKWCFENKQYVYDVNGEFWFDAKNFVKLSWEELWKLYLERDLTCTKSDNHNNVQKRMTSKELSEIFIKNINSRLCELFEKVNKEISPMKIEHEEIFGVDWIESLQSGVDIIVNNALIKGEPTKDKSQCKMCKGRKEILVSVM